MQPEFNLDKPLVAIAPMEDSIIDVVVMHLILKKVAADLKQKQFEVALTDWIHKARSLSDKPREWTPEFDESSSN